MSTVTERTGWQVVRPSERGLLAPPIPVGKYNVVGFSGRMEAMAIGLLVKDFVQSPDGAAWLTGPSRAVIRVPRAFTERATLFMSDGAIEAAKAAGVLLRSARRVGPRDLPRECTLLVGDEGDLD